MSHAARHPPPASAAPRAPGLSRQVPCAVCFLCSSPSFFPLLFFFRLPCPRLQRHRRLPAPPRTAAGTTACSLLRAVDSRGGTNSLSLLNGRTPTAEQREDQDKTRTTRATHRPAPSHPLIVPPAPSNPQCLAPRGLRDETLTTLPQPQLGTSTILANVAAVSAATAAATTAAAAAATAAGDCAPPGAGQAAIWPWLAAPRSTLRRQRSPLPQSGSRTVPPS